MKIKYLAIVATVSVISFAYMNTNTPVFSNHVLAACAGNPCAANPCAANPCAANPCAANADSAPAIYTESTSGLAIRGTDPVAYFTVGKAVAGSSDYEYQWNGATWRFSSQENMELFVANPEQYAPQYGGYCAKGISEGNLVSIDPNAWRIVDGKLYLNYSKDVQKQWLQDIEGNIKLGNENYPSALKGGEVFEN
jgi:YHS domain-containing protein